MLNKRFIAFVPIAFLAACVQAPNKPFDVGTPQPDPNNPCFSNTPYKVTTGNVTVTTIKREFAGSACATAEERKLMLTGAFDILEHPFKGGATTPEVQLQAIDEALDVLIAAHKAGEISAEDIRKRFEKRGIDIAKIAERRIRSDLKQLITFDLYNRTGRVNETKWEELNTYLTEGFKPWNVGAPRIKEILIEMLPNTPAVVGFKAVTGADGKKTHDYVAIILTMRDIETKRDFSHMVTPLLLSGLTQEQREGILFAAWRDYKNNMLVANAIPPYNNDNYNNGDQGIVQIAAIATVPEQMDNAL